MRCSLTADLVFFNKFISLVISVNRWVRVFCDFVDIERSICLCSCRFLNGKVQGYIRPPSHLIYIFG